MASASRPIRPVLAALVLSIVALSAVFYLFRQLDETATTIFSYDDVSVLDDRGRPTAQDFDLFVPSTDDRHARPLLVFLHGGGFWSGAKEDMQATAEDFARLGYVTASVSYELSPEVRDSTDVVELEAAMRIALDDVREAINYLGAESSTYMIDRKRIGVIGFSAGGALALASESLVFDDVSALDETLEIDAVVGFSTILGPSIFPNIKEAPAPIKIVKFSDDTEDQAEFDFGRQETLEAFTARGGIAEVELIPGRGHDIEIHSEMDRFVPFLREHLDLPPSFG